MSRGDVHVMQEGKKWAVKVEGSAQASSTYNTQAAAAKAGRSTAKRNQSELLVHGRNGQVRQKSSYGRDPRPTRG